MTAFDNRRVSREIDRQIAPLLLQAGFRSDGSRRFLRETGRSVVVLELPSCGSLKDWSNPATAIIGWYGVFFREIGRYDDHLWPEQKLLASSCHTGAMPLLRGMPPRLWKPQGENIWLTQDEQSLKLCIPDLQKSVCEQILNRLEEFDSFDFMRQTLEQGRDCLITRYHRAVFHKLYGSAEQYEACLELYLQEVARLDARGRKNQSEPKGPNPRALP